MVKVSSTLIYLLALLALGSCMMVMLFGISGVHSSMFQLQTSVSFQEHEIMRLREAHQHLAGDLLEQAKVKDTVDLQAREVTNLRQKVDHDVGLLQTKVEEQKKEAARSMDKAIEQQTVKGREEQAKRDTAQEEARRRAEARLQEMQRQIEEKQAQQQRWHDESQQEVQRLRLAHSALELLVANLTNLLPGLLQQQKATPSEAASTPAPAPAATSRALLQAEESEVHPPAHLSAPSPPLLLSTQQPPSYQVRWYRECGCTGMEIEAVTLLAGLADRIGSARLRTNKCSETCLWPTKTQEMLTQLEVDERSLWPQTQEEYPKPGEKLIMVIHAAFVGVCGSPDIGLPWRNEEDNETEKGLYRVSRSMLETDRVEHSAVAQCNSQWDAVWVPSAFNQRSFSQSGIEAKRLKILPEAVDTELFTCQAASSSVAKESFNQEKLDEFVKAAADNSTFTFLSIFKWEERKNWRGLFETFLRAFPEGVTLVALEDETRANVTVRLLVKTQELSWGTKPDEDLSDLLGTLGTSLEALEKRVLVVQDTFHTEQMPTLYRAADAFVLPTHGEGWGLPLMEAMASGLPVITTGWGGQTEFMNSGNAWMLGYKMVASDPMNPDSEHQWAEPDLAELRHDMVEAVQRSSSSRAKAAKGCQEIHDHFSPTVVAARTDALLTGLLSGA